MKSHPRSRARMRRASVAVCAVGIAGLAAAAAAAAENPYKLKPGAKGALCLECHVAFEDTLKRAHVHTPVKNGDCSDCHDPHASSHGALLAAEPARVCIRCHENVAVAGAASAHTAVQEGNCTACHDPHASGHPNGLLRAGNDLCAGCHEHISQAAADAEFSHAPVRDACLSCHDPHSSAESDFLLTSSEPGLCVDCHDPRVSAFRSRHMNYPVEKARCTSCHDPHGSDRSALLWANVHQPLVRRMCAQCHPSPEASEPLSVKRAGVDLCRGCHSDVANRISAARRVHWPVADRKACLNCHNPHASPVPSLLSQPTKSLCGGCHRDTIARGERSAVKHAPVTEGECGGCHEPHASDGPLLFRGGNETEVCATCHDWGRHTMHPVGEGIVDMRNPNLLVGCGSCHRGHGSAHEHMTVYDSKHDLCVECHEALRR